jgi:hypothetical protein
MRFYSHLIPADKDFIIEMPNTRMWYETGNGRMWPNVPRSSQSGCKAIALIHDLYSPHPLHRIFFRFSTKAFPFLIIEFSFKQDICAREFCDEFHDATYVILEGQNWIPSTCRQRYLLHHDSSVAEYNALRVYLTFLTEEGTPVRQNMIGLIGTACLQCTIAFAIGAKEAIACRECN